MRALSLIIFLTIWAAPLWAEESVGQLILDEGQAKIDRNHLDIVLLKPGKQEKVEVGDELFIGDASRARLVLANGNGELRLYSKSLVRLYNTGKKNLIGLPIGKALVELNDSANLEITTANSRLSTKGAKVLVWMQGKETWVLMLKGSGQVINLVDPEKQVSLQAGQATAVYQNEAPSPPLAFDPETLSEALNLDSNQPALKLRQLWPLPLPPIPPKGPLNKSSKSERDRIDEVEQQLDQAREQINEIQKRD